MSINELELAQLFVKTEKHQNMFEYLIKHSSIFNDNNIKVKWLSPDNTENLSVTWNECGVMISMNFKSYDYLGTFKYKLKVTEYIDYIIDRWSIFENKCLSSRIERILGN